MRHTRFLLIGVVAVATVVFLLMAKGSAVPLAQALGLKQSPIAESCSDGLQNQDEADVDCGGVCGPCAAGRRCSSNADCSYRTACEEGVCRALEWHAEGCAPLLDGHDDTQAENLNIVFAGVGYDDPQLFLKDARAAMRDDVQPHPGIFFYEPMKSVKEKINAWYIEPIGELQPAAAGDCRARCKSTLGEEYCPMPNRQVIYLCDADCAMSAAMGGDLYVGKSPQQPYEVVHGFGHSYGFLEDTKEDSLMGDYLRIGGRQPKPEDFSAEDRAQIAERLGRHRGKDYAPWYMLWIVFDEHFDIIAAREHPSAIGEGRRLAAPYILRLNGGALSYVFDFDASRTVVTEQFSPRTYAATREELRYIEVPLPLKLSKLSEDKLKLIGYKGTVEPYTIDIMGPSGELVKRIPAEELVKFLR